MTGWGSVASVNNDNPDSTPALARFRAGFKSVRPAISRKTPLHYRKEFPVPSVNLEPGTLIRKQFYL
jgi:hypothetical protein